ncbi:MAG: beta-galactosidase, partial [Anaerolineae bacterium]|nr:beta-galactosidase [Anaerolineae bacterium]
QYFQFRKGRGGAEKFHAAVVDHVGHEHTRMFAEVAQVGADLARLDCLIGTSCPAAVGLIVDWESWWALKGSQGPSAVAKNYLDWCLSHYIPFWKRGIGVDVINMDQDFGRYRVLIAPSLYLLRPGVAERVRAFVEGGGTFVTTYLTGITDENDRVFLGGWPGPLKDVLGVWAEEIDYLYEDERNTLVMAPGNALGLEGTYTVSDICDVIHAQGAAVLATYGADFYAGRPALTAHRFGRGTAYYLAAKAEQPFLEAFYGRLAAGLPRALAADLPTGVTARLRTDGERDYVFVMNFTAEPRAVALDAAPYRDLLSGETVADQIELGPYGVRMLARPARRDG